MPAEACIGTLQALPGTAARLPAHPAPYLFHQLLYTKISTIVFYKKFIKLCSLDMGHSTRYMKAFGGVSVLWYLDLCME
jgi:hypothetical protein